MIRLINRLQQYAIRRCNNIVFYCIDFILHFDSRKRSQEKRENCSSGEKTDVYDLLFVYSDCWRCAVATAFYFIMHCMNQARQNYIGLVTSLLFLSRRRLYLALVCIVLLLCVCLSLKSKKRRKLLGQNNDNHFMMLLLMQLLH